MNGKFNTIEVSQNPICHRLTFLEQNLNKGYVVKFKLSFSDFVVNGAK